MFRFQMNMPIKKRPANETPYYISRLAFQSILHHALTAESKGMCFGFLGSNIGGNNVIQHVSLLPAWRGSTDMRVTNIPTILSEWEKKSIQCIGLVSLINSDVPTPILDIMPENYIAVAVSLSEKGRLDLEAILHVGEGSMEHIKQCKCGTVNLMMIEDGQKVAHA